MSDTVLLALAAQCPTAESDVIACAQLAINDNDAASAQGDGIAYLQRASLSRVEQQACHVSNEANGGINKHVTPLTYITSGLSKCNVSGVSAIC